MNLAVDLLSEILQQYNKMIQFAFAPLNCGEFTIKLLALYNPVAYSDSSVSSYRKYNKLLLCNCLRSSALGISILKIWLCARALFNYIFYWNQIKFW